MGVLRSLRNESTAEFLNKADDLRAFTTKTVAKIPKKYTFYGCVHAYELAQAIYDDLERANNLYLTKTNTENYAARREYFNKALGNLSCLSSHIVYLCDLVETAEDRKLDKQPNQATQQKQQQNVGQQQNESGQENSGPTNAKQEQKPKEKRITDKRWLAWASKINIVKALVLKVRDSDTQRVKR